MNSPALRYLGIACLIILTDFFLFPIGLTFLPGLNTKTIMAVVGVTILLFNTSDTKYDFLDKNFIFLSLWAIGVSLVCFVAVVVSGTNDYTYVSYIVSMWVWLFAAYFLVISIGKVHDTLSIQLISNYLLAVCVIQGLVCLGLEHNTNFSNFIKSIHIGLVLVFETKGRLQGIAAALDPAGIRFAASLVIIGYVLINNNFKDKYWIYIYIISFFFITMVGSMIARTTVVGAGIAIIYWIFVAFFGNDMQKHTSTEVWRAIFICIIFFLPMVIFYYHTNAHFKDNIRFGFEGFFSLLETGSWEVGSNKILKAMIVFPDNLKTWLIGDGYIVNPSTGSDPYYVGELYKGYYKDTDIGYLRFIFYAGLPLLISFIGFFIYATSCCMNKFPANKMLFFLLLVLNFGIWFKVSTDIFQFFAIFLAIPQSMLYNEKEDSVLEN